MSNRQTICLHNDTDSTYTQVSNTFIDEYMPSANGTYVKVYLTLLRLIGKRRFNISLCYIADVLELTEKDVARALSYWEKNNLLKITHNASGAICDITFNTPGSSADDSADRSAMYNADAAAGHIAVPASDKPAGSNNMTASATSPGAYTASEISKITTTEEFSWIITILENYMQRTLTPTDIELVVYLYDSLHFSSDLIFYLYEYCISRGKKNSKYIQAVAINWADSGVDSIEKAQACLAAYDAKYMDIMRAFGINQAPAPVQKNYIDTWFSLGFDVSVIKEACNRTVLAVNEPSFKYANGILENWHRQGIKTPEDIKTADSIYASASKAPSKPKTKQKNTFNSYDQRDYSGSDYSDLERQLLSQ